MCLNDEAFDKIWIEGIKNGNRLFYSISNSFIAKLILKAGITSIWKRNHYATAIKSHGLADFGLNQLRHEFNMYNTEYDGRNEGNGAFFRVNGGNTIYNFADFSQFVWGAWMKANNYSGFETRSGAHINNLFFGSGFLDSGADQRAIINGHNYMNNLFST